jgi:hypothetical protein
VGVRGAEYGCDGADKDLEFEPDGPRRDVFEVGLDTRLDVGRRSCLAAKAAHLARAGDAGLDLMPVGVLLKQFAIGATAPTSARSPARPWRML